MKLFKIGLIIAACSLGSCRSVDSKKDSAPMPDPDSVEYTLKNYVIADFSVDGQSIEKSLVVLEAKINSFFDEIRKPHISISIQSGYYEFEEVKIKRSTAYQALEVICVLSGCDMKFDDLTVVLVPSNPFYL